MPRTGPPTDDVVGCKPGVRMSVPAQEGPQRGIVWSRRLRDPAAILEVARHVTEGRVVGLTGPRVRSATRAIRRLLASEGGARAELSGRLTLPGSLPRDVDTAQLVDDVLHTESRRRHAEVVAEPLIVHDELAGVLVVAGTTRVSALREVTALLVAALARGRLEASAEERKSGVEGERG